MDTQLTDGGLTEQALDLQPSQGLQTLATVAIMLWMFLVHMHQENFKTLSTGLSSLIALILLEKL
jgi:hypothetical protein